MSAAEAVTVQGGAAKASSAVESTRATAATVVIGDAAAAAVAVAAAAAAAAGVTCGKTEAAVVPYMLAMVPKVGPKTRTVLIAARITESARSRTRP